MYKSKLYINPKIFKISIIIFFRDNAVYRSNSFKYERKSPNIGLRLKTLDKPQQQLQLQQHQLNQLKDVKLRKPVQPAQPELQQVNNSPRKT